MQNALYKGADMFINAPRSRTAMRAIQYEPVNPIISKDITLANWVNATVRILPRRIVVSLGPTMLPTPTNNEDNPNRVPMNESDIAKRSLKNTFMYGIRMAAPKPIRKLGVASLIVRYVRPGDDSVGDSSGCDCS